MVSFDHRSLFPDALLTNSDDWEKSSLTLVEMRRSWFGISHRSARSYSSYRLDVFRFALTMIPKCPRRHYYWHNNGPVENLHEGVLSYVLLLFRVPSGPFGKVGVWAAWPYLNCKGGSLFSTFCMLLAVGLSNDGSGGFSMWR